MPLNWKQWENRRKCARLVSALPSVIASPIGSSHCRKPYEWTPYTLLCGQAYTTESRFKVHCLRHPFVVASSLGLRFRKAGKFLAGSMRPMVLINVFAGRSIGCKCEEREKSFFCLSGSLCLPGNATNWAHSRSRRRQLFRLNNAAKDNIVQVCKGPLAGKIVRLQDIERSLSMEQLATSWDADSSWHRPTSYGFHCYHVISFGHRLRWLCPPEAEVERWGSLLHNLYADQAQHTSARLAMRLFIKEANLACDGDSRDECVVAEIARCVIEEKNMTPLNKKAKAVRSQGLRADFPVHKNTWVDKSWAFKDNDGPWQDDDIEEFRRATKPISMDIRVAKAVEDSMMRTALGEMRRDAHGRKLLHPLPYVPVGKKDASRDITASVLRGGRGAWDERGASAGNRNGRASRFLGFCEDSLWNDCGGNC